MFDSRDNAPDELGDLPLEGTTLRWAAWGRRGLPGLVLIHGARGHWRWWARCLTERLRARRRIVAFDLSGHGDSGRRPAYRAEAWAGEVAAVIAACVGDRAAVAGHSMGGFVAIAAAAAHPDRVASLALLDVLVRRPTARTGAERRGMPRRPLRVYPDRERAIEAFRLVPAPRVLNRELVREIAAASVRPCPGGWTWKFDPAVAQRFSDDAIAANLGAVRCPVGYLYGELSRHSGAATADLVGELCCSPVARRGVPGCDHHLLLDRPAAVGDGLAALLGELDGELSPREPSKRSGG